MPSTIMVMRTAGTTICTRRGIIRKDEKPQNFLPDRAMSLQIGWKHVLRSKLGANEKAERWEQWVWYVDILGKGKKRF